MRIELRGPSRKWIGRILVDPTQRPTRVQLEDGTEIFLRWDRALDDAGQLRRCVACDCPALFREKAFPQITGFVVVLAFAGAVVGALGYATTPPVLAAMALVLTLDVMIFFVSRKRLVCYRCRTSYHDLPIARYHAAWDRPTADRQRPAPDAPAPAGTLGAAEPATR
jgi:hypothetical protein